MNDTTGLTQGPSTTADNWADDPLWHKDAIIYQLHVKAFFDSNNDGTGDFIGLTEKLDYICDLGVNTIWLLPFYPSPMRDDGYDISDYRNIASNYGTRQDFRKFVRAAHRRGLKIIIELVINHTSDQHPWFQAARRAAPKSALRNYYVWSDDDGKFPETRIIFSDTEDSNWAWDPVAKSYYWHRFFSHQPDLNHNNPQVVKAVIRNLEFWLDQGVDGLRLDAIPYLCVREGTHNENLPETHAVIKKMRATVDAQYQNRILLAEANQWPEDVREYFGDDDECHMAYHFPLMPRMYMAVAQEDRHPIVEIMNQTPDIPANCQWAIFLRNHDELTLEMVTDRERDYMYEQYAGDPRMRLNVGIRRRLGPLMDNDLDKIQLMNSLLLSMPGSPIIYYGDEIGMGDNVYLGDRNGVRTPMQWSPDRNAGFSKADPQLLYLPPVMDPIYGYDAVNVEAQSRDRSSLLNWMKRLTAVRKRHKAFGRGSLNFLHPGNRKILAYTREYDGEAILCVANLARSAQPVELNLARFKGRIPTEMLGHTPFPPVGELPYLLTLPSYGVYWFLLLEGAAEPTWHQDVLLATELPVLVMADGWDSFFPHEVQVQRRPLAETFCKQIMQDILPRFLATQRWFEAKQATIDRVELSQLTRWKEGPDEWVLCFAEVRFAEMRFAEAHHNAMPTLNYFIPLAKQEQEAEEYILPLLSFTLAKVRQQARVGILYDAFADTAFCTALVLAMEQNRRLAFGSGWLQFSATAAAADFFSAAERSYTVHQPKTSGSNTAVILGDQLFLKGYRQVKHGRNPELEVGRFLTEVSPYPHVVPVLGAMEYQRADEEPVTLALLQRFVPNQGDAWTFTLDYLKRCLEQCAIKPSDSIPDVNSDIHLNFLMLIRRLGQRTGELHQALAKSTGDPAFDPEPISDADLDEWRRSVHTDLQQAVHALQTAQLPPTTQELADRVIILQPEIQTRIDDWIGGGFDANKTRHHGDYHLGQVLVTENDFVIIDFEGEPIRSVAERCRKSSAVRDVAGMLRSLDYAAHAAMKSMDEQHPQLHNPLQRFVQQWRSQCTETFLEGYEQAVANCSVYPQDRAAGRTLIGFFMLQKALYEIKYELGSRPAWVTIPLEYLLSLFGDTDAKVHPDSAL